MRRQQRMQVKLLYPLAWPQGRRRTTEPRASAKWRKTIRSARAGEALVRRGESLSCDDAVLRLEVQLTVLGVREASLHTDGWGRHKVGEDVGAVVQFQLLGSPLTIACDKWDRLADNIAAIAAHIESLRSQERWGCSRVEEAFAGHRFLLPAAATVRPWWEVLGLDPKSKITPEAVKDAYLRGAKLLHPDRGADGALMADLTRARDEALRDPTVVNG